MPDGQPAKHSDQYTPIIGNGNGEYSTRATYRDLPEKDGYGSVAVRGTGLELNHPVADIETLHRTAHLAAQFHEHNRDQWETQSPYPNDGSILYDLTILDVADAALDEETLDPSALDVLEPRFKTLFLKAARHPRNNQAFYEHLKASPPVLSALGYSDAMDLPSYSTFQRVAQSRLPNELDELERGKEAFEAARTRAVYAAFRNGVQPPNTVREAYGFDARAPPFSERSVRWDDEQYALRNWIQFLANETLDPLTFAREEPQFDILHFLGLLATSALTGSGLQTAAKVSFWDHHPADVPKGTGLPKYISNRVPSTQRTIPRTNTSDETPTIEAQFDAVHENTLALAARLGFFTDPVSLAVDLYRIEWTGSDDAPTIDRPHKSENDVRTQWTYAVIGILDTEARFTLGTRWLKHKSEYPHVIKQMLPGEPLHFDVKAIYADSEMVPGELITAFRAIAGSDWIIKSPDHSVIKSLKALTPSGYTGHVLGVPWNCSPKPNAVAYPYGSTQPSPLQFTVRELQKDDPKPATTHQTTLTDESEANEAEDPLVPTLTEKFDDPETLNGIRNQSTHTAYLTDRTIPERSAGGIHFNYYQRWAIEEAINQISNHFMPVIESSNPKLRLYGINIAILLQNWHTLINRAASPELGLRLSVTHPELLKAVQHVAFGHR